MTVAGTGLTVVDAVVTPAVAAPCLRIGQAQQNNNQQGQQGRNQRNNNQNNNQEQGQNQDQGQGGQDGQQNNGQQGDQNQGQNQGQNQNGQQDQGQNQDQGQGQDGQQGQDQNGQQGDQGQNQGQNQGGQQNDGQQGQGQNGQQGDQELQSFGRERRDPGDSGRNNGGNQGGNKGNNGGNNGNNGGNQGGNNNGGNNGGQNGGNDGGNNNGGNNGGNGGNNGGDQGACEDVGPALSDFANVRTFPRASQPRFNRNGSRGTFVSRCGTNRNGHFNSDNHIVAPGVSNGAQHQHDYVGNLTTSGQSTDESLAAGGTTCARDDRSAYFWPVLRDRTRQGNDANAPGGGQDGNIGRILTPRAAIMEFRGNPQSKVVAAPRFLRLITGDAKSAVNGAANAKAGWTCSGFTNRISGDKYPLCPRGSLVTRILDFPSCWDGQNLDSANHRTHVVFPDGNGACPSGTQAIPQLRMTLTYAAPAGANFAVDSFPDQKHAPITDHADFHNVMPENLMNLVVNCINGGRRC